MANPLTVLTKTLGARFLERGDQIHGSLCALVARQHVLLLGPPGTAKSLLARSLCASIHGATYFEWLLTKTSTPEELFGPISLKALEDDRYTRILLGKLPEAHIAFVDEIFKASSAILNTMLTLLNERVFHNNGKPVEVPLLTCFAASNELPESEELGALYDRFLLRYTVDYLQEDGHFIDLLKLQPVATKPVLKLADLQKAQADASKVALSDDLLGKVLAIRKALRAEGIAPSDRRFRDALSLVRAAAYLDGKKSASEEDLGVLKDVLWNQPPQRQIVARTVIGVASPLEVKSLELYDQAAEISRNATAAPEDQKSAKGLEAVTKLKRIGKELEAIQDQVKANPSAWERVTSRKEQVASWHKDVARVCLGL